MTAKYAFENCLISCNIESRELSFKYLLCEIEARELSDNCQKVRELSENCHKYLNRQLPTIIRQRKYLIK